MAHCYLAPYIGTGTDADPFRPLGSDQDGWAALDFRPDSTVLAGRALLSVPVRNDLAGQTYLGDTADMDTPSDALKTAIQNRFGITLTNNRLRAIILELLTNHARTDGTRWRPLIETHQRRMEIWLGEKIWDVPVIAGGVSLSDNFDRADASTLGSPWVTVRLASGIISNTATNKSTNSCHDRYDTVLATGNHFAQVDVTATVDNVAVAPMTRMPSSGDSGYFFQFQDFAGSDERLRMFKVVTGTFTQLGTDITGVGTGVPRTLRTETNGSTISGYSGGVFQQSNTDTALPGTNIRCGLRTTGVVINDARADNWSAGDLVTAARHQRSLTGVGR